MTIENKPTRYKAREGFQITVTDDLQQKGIDENDLNFQTSIYAQLIAALDKYPQDKRFNHHIFHPFAFLTEQKTRRILVGSIEGNWGDNPEGYVYTFKKAVIHHLCETPQEFQQLASAIQTFNPGVPKITSESFVAVRQHQQDEKS